MLLHGLTATRRNVVQGSRALIRKGYRLIAYDARGHGASVPRRRGYEYADLVGDLEAVLDDLELERAALVGSSMGAATAMAFTLEHPERVPALVQITPAYTGYARTGDVDGDTWERMAAELDAGGVDAFVRGGPARRPARELARDRARGHAPAHGAPRAPAGGGAGAPRACRARSPGRAWSRWRRSTCRCWSSGRRDEADPLHPLGVAEQYVAKLPRAELVVEDKGSSPLAWQGARLSGVIADFFERVGYAPS